MSFADIGKKLRLPGDEVNRPKVVRDRFWKIMNYLHFFDEKWDSIKSKKDLQAHFERAKKDPEFAESFYFDYTKVESPSQ